MPTPIVAVKQNAIVFTDQNRTNFSCSKTKATEFGKNAAAWLGCSHSGGEEEACNVLGHSCCRGISTAGLTPAMIKKIPHV